MPTPTKGPRLGANATHQRAILAGLAADLFEHGRVTTTVTKAKRVQPLAESLITKAKKGDLNSRRQVAKVIRNKTIHIRDAEGDAKTIIHKLFTEIAPAVAERPGGYTRITKIGNRKGDNAPLAVIELVLDPYSPKQAVVKEAEKAAEKASKKAEEVVAEEVVEEAAAETEEVAADAEATEAAEESK